MAIHAIHFNSVACFSVQFSVAVTVLFKMAVNAVHPLFQMNIFQMNSLLEFVRIIERDWVAIFIQKNTFAIVLESSPENPAVTVEVCELRVLEVLIEFRSPRLLQEIYIRPTSANRSPLRIPLLDRLLFFRTKVALLLRIHLVAIDFVVPPGVAKIRCDHIGARMDMANNALARRNRSSELVLEWVSRLILRNRRIGRRRLPKITPGRIVPGMFLRTIVGINHMASRASAGAVVPGLVVRSRKRQQRIKQARFLQTENRGICPRQRAKAALAEFNVRLSRRFFKAGNSDFRLLFASTLKRPQHVPRLRNLPSL